jgi:hypothetical protein
VLLLPLLLLLLLLLPNAMHALGGPLSPAARHTAALGACRPRCARLTDADAAAHLLLLQARSSMQGTCRLLCCR